MSTTAGNEMRYGDYLALDAILAAQHPRSSDPNELLFIVQHQTSELWMKLALHELRTARAAIAASDLPPAFKMLARVSRILEQLVHAWNVLATMTPPEYSAIRPHLGTSSGFQSWQYREIEFMLGNKNAAMLRPHDDRPDLKQRLEAAFAAPSLYDEAIRLLARRGFAIDPAVTRTRPDQASCRRRDGRSGVARGLSRAPRALGVVRTRRRAGRPRGRVPAVAVSPCDHGRAHHRIQARHRWHQRRRLPAQDARRRAVSRTLESTHGPLGRAPDHRAGRGRGVTSPASGPDFRPGAPVTASTFARDATPPRRTPDLGPLPPGTADRADFDRDRLSARQDRAATGRRQARRRRRP